MILKKKQIEKNTKKNLSKLINNENIKFYRVDFDSIPLKSTTFLVSIMSLKII